MGRPPLNLRKMPQWPPPLPTSSHATNGCGLPNDLIRIDEPVFAFVRDWILRRGGPNLSNNQIEPLVGTALQEHVLRFSGQQFFERHDVHMFVVVRTTSPGRAEELLLGAVRLPACSAGPSWLVGTPDKTRADENYRRECDEVVALAESKLVAAKDVEAHAPAAATTKSCEVIRPDKVKTTPSEQAPAIPKHSAAPVGTATEQDGTKTFSAVRCAVAGVWGSLVYSGVIATVDGPGWWIVLIPIAGLPWLFFAINDHSIRGQRLELFEACGTLLGGAFLSGFCAIPFALIYAIIRGLGR